MCETWTKGRNFYCTHASWSASDIFEPAVILPTYVSRIYFQLSSDADAPKMQMMLLTYLKGFSLVDLSFSLSSLLLQGIMNCLWGRERASAVQCQSLIFATADTQLFLLPWARGHRCSEVQTAVHFCSDSMSLLLHPSRLVLSLNACVYLSVSVWYNTYVFYTNVQTNNICT